MRLAVLALVTVAALGASACHHRHVHVEEVRGSDGQDWKKYSCPHLDRRCFAVARSMCPNGYYFAKDPVAISSEEAHAKVDAPAAGARAKTLPPQERWGREMYSDAPGTLLVRCAEAPSKDAT